MSNLPKGWLYTSLIDIVTLHDNKRIPLNQKQRLERKGSYPYYGANGQIDSVNDFIFDGNYILLAEDGGYFDDPSRRVAYEVSGKFWVNNHAHILSPCNQIFIKFLTYCLNTIHWMEYVTGTTRLKLTQEGMKRVIIPLPPLEEQKRIAEILDRSQFLISKRQEAIAQLETLTQAIFIEMFGDPVINPKGWTIEKLGKLGTLDRGISKHRPRNAPELLGGIYPLVQTGDVANSGGYIRHYKNTYSEVGLRQSKMWKTGTLCITIAANIAKTGILTFDACFPDSIVGFLAKDFATIEFVRVWLSFIQKTLEETAPESAQKNINLGTLRDLSIPFPPLPLQKEFAHRVEAVEKLKATHRESLSELQALFASLQHLAFRGEL